MPFSIHPRTQMEINNCAWMEKKKEDEEEKNQNPFSYFYAFLCEFEVENRKRFSALEPR
jgi:hypothetical protein